jgi:hypothetical protein
MRKIATLGVAAVFAALSFTAATAPAQAGGISFGFGDYDGDFDFGYDHWDDDDYGIVVEIDPDDYIVEDDDYDASDSDNHTDWCEAQYQTYDADTDMYFYKPGKQKRCISPWS